MLPPFPGLSGLLLSGDDSLAQVEALHGLLPVLVDHDRHVLQLSFVVDADAAAASGNVAVIGVCRRVSLAMGGGAAATIPPLTAVACVVTGGGSLGGAGAGLALVGKLILLVHNDGG